MVSPLQKATRHQTKNHNKRLTLKTIYERVELSRADIARATGLTRPTVSSAVAELIEEGLVEETGLGPSEGGKPPILVRVVDNSRHLLAVDLANRDLQGVVCDLRGQVLHRLTLPLADSIGQQTLDRVFALIEQLLAQATSPVLGIGLGTPGLIDVQQGVVRHAVNLGWTNLPLRDLVQSRWNLPVYIVNDAQAAALAEYTFGDHPGPPNLVVVKVGRGASAGLVLNGQLYEGVNAGASEIGHVRVVENGELCLCGHYGCLETVVSSRTLVSRAKTLAQRDPRSSLHRFVANPEALTTDNVLAAFEAGDETVKPLITEMGHYLGIAVANIVGVLNVQDVRITGSLARFGEALLEPVRAEVAQRIFTPIAEQTRIRLSKLGQDSVVLGAVALLLTHQLEVV
ncbi:MAG TPA: ROK family transcriptional regulator [Anaerolineae bacterium]|nr:ROK family transcriptional regulator [Anaerolineae bacterium]